MTDRSQYPESTPRWLIVRLGADLNWWIDQSADELGTKTGPRSVLDPRQVAQLLHALESYQPYGLTPEHAAEAFQVYAAESELDDGRLRLTVVDEPLTSTAEQFFALPLVDEAGTDPYCRFLDALSAARIRLLNATHDYTRACTTSEMYEELDALDSDRYFSDDTFHVFDELNEILTWSPAEWDDA